MVKAKTCSCCDKTAVRKGAWTPEEDSKLTDYVSSYGHWNWRQIPKFAGLSRCGKSCRLRWKNYLMPTIRRKNYTKEEEEIIIQLHQSTGGSWTAIAARLPGRTDNDIKNHWNTVLKKRVMNHKEEPLIMVDETEKTSSNVNEVVIEQPSNYSTFMDLAGLESVLDSIELWPPAIETTWADDVAVTGDGIDVSVDDYFYSSSSSSPVEGTTFDDIWTYDPFWENFFDTQFDENNH